MRITSFMNWCDDQGPAGCVIFVVLCTLLCCTGIALVLILASILFPEE